MPISLREEKPLKHGEGIPSFKCQIPDTVKMDGTFWVELTRSGGDNRNDNLDNQELVGVANLVVARQTLESSGDNHVN